ncbi:uncharacterized protein [Diabrotica undecimpunctata]|uniref:uncharacterized protein n=1 Tax=Diabrotica undecimpunctata TaxID=50387 RepID=UPI003B63FF86
MPRLSKIAKCKRKKAVAEILSIIIAVASLLVTNSERRERRWWIRPWLNKKRGNISLTEEFIQVDDEKYSNFLRMNEGTFNKLLGIIEHVITKKSIFPDTISAKHKLIITLRYLATGESFRSLMYNYRVSESAISLFIPIVCEAIYEALKNEYLKVPRTTAEWLEIAKDFETLWNIPNVVGALDGKHIMIKAPKSQGSAYFNYKKQHSIVLLAFVDAKYNFTYINVGTNGRISDGGVFWESDLSQALAQNYLNFPKGTRKSNASTLCDCR